MAEQTHFHTFEYGAIKHGTMAGDTIMSSCCGPLKIRTTITYVTFYDEED